MDRCPCAALFFAAPAFWCTRGAYALRPVRAAPFFCTGRLGHLNRASGSPCPSGIFSAPAERGARTALACLSLTGGSFSAPADRGVRTASACSSLTGGSFSAPADRGARTASACSSLTGGIFSAPADRGARTASACSSLTGGEFFAEIQQGFALCGAREIAAPAAGAKRKGHLRFPFLFELLPFPCFLIWRRFPICDRSEIRGTAVGLP